VSVTNAPITAEDGDRAVICGVGSTVNPGALLFDTPLTVTVTKPLLAPAGTVVTTCVSLQLVGNAAVPLKLTMLPAGAEPNPLPRRITCAPIGAADGLTLTMCGVTTKLKLLLGTPFTVTIIPAGPAGKPPGTSTGRVVALQLSGVTGTPPKLTALLFGISPKFLPVIAIVVPAGPEAGDRAVMHGVGNTVKSAPLLDNPSTVTTTFPLTAPFGTDTTIWVLLQLVGVAVVPLKVTALFP
jgi:hypothetical protein